MMYLKDFYSELILTDDQARAVEKLQVFLDGDEQVFAWEKSLTTEYILIYK